MKTISVGDVIVISWLDNSGTATETAILQLVRTENVNDGEIRVASPLGIALLGARSGETVTIYQGGITLAVRVEEILQQVDHG